MIGLGWAFGKAAAFTPPQSAHSLASLMTGAVCLECKSPGFRMQLLAFQSRVLLFSPVLSLEDPSLSGEGLRKGRPCFQALESFLPLESLPQECVKELASLCHNLLHQSLVRSWDQGEKKESLGCGKTRLPLLYQTVPSHLQVSARPWHQQPVKVRAALPRTLVLLSCCSSFLLHS